MHGIRREELEEGLDPATVLTVLNRIICPHAAFCDGGASDFGWARRLVLAACFMNTFRLGDNPAPHRAGLDAVLLMRALAHGFGLYPVGEPLRMGADRSRRMSAHSDRAEPDCRFIEQAIERELEKAARVAKTDDRHGHRLSH